MQKLASFVQYTVPVNDWNMIMLHRGVCKLIIVIINKLCKHCFNTFVIYAEHVMKHSHLNLINTEHIVHRCYT